MAGFTIDASEALALRAELEAAHTTLVAEVRKATSDAGRNMQATARSLAAHTSFRGLAGSIYTQTKQSASGIEVTVEAKSPFGYIEEFGAGRKGPHPFMLPALQSHLPAWEDSVAEAAGRALR